ncbi:site-2 protease family protein [Candidatus Magnetaquicoccus inordinatus]|uniref:site-2 protease family protein n=1 Tax=Candidatus Magnetaquicoccus inordinatus TaxID=2496818 RepID=UPI00102B61F3|nr:site-2 protease family protein [Candidatus Magnetaquicoccus inordinatus]
MPPGSRSNRLYRFISYSLLLPSLAPSKIATYTVMSQSALQPHLPELLPLLREELQLSPGPPAHNGAPTWTIHDPGNNRYYRIGWLSFELLSRWHLRNVPALLQATHTETTLQVTANDVEHLLRMLERHSLLQASGDSDLWRLRRLHAAGQQSWSSWLIHHYLFVRIPLLHPDHLLARLLTYCSWLYSRQWLTLLLLLTFLGLLLIVRQWDSFVTTLSRSWNSADPLPYALAMALSKSLHELGHALTAKRYGCRVPVMGVALMVLWPVLYTETSDIWKLPDKRQRLLVAAAGMVAELTLAALATLLWSLLEDGPLREATFILASTTWILTLTVNLNPLMRFDGYYLLSDWLDWINLQERAFAMGRWFVRKLIFGFAHPPPERLPLARRRFLILFAWAVWLYRLLLFTGIALLVYHFFFKLLGIVLFAVEIIYFVLRPFAKEMAVWWQMRTSMRVNGHTLLSTMVLLTALTALFLPWVQSMEAPATLRVLRQSRLFAPQAALLRAPLPEAGTYQEAGTILVQLEDPELQQRAARLQREIERIQWQLTAITQDKELLEQRQSLLELLHTRQTERAATRKEEQRLQLRAPFSGKISEQQTALRAGEWVAEGEYLLQMIDPEEWVIEGYIAGNPPGIVAQAEALFYPENSSLAVIRCRLQSVDAVNTPRLPEPELASRYGGPIAVREEKSEELLPREAQFRMRLTLIDAPPAQQQLQRGTLRIAIQPQAPAVRLWRYLASSIMRESGW